MNATCPFCLQTVGTIPGFEHQPVFEYHKNGDKACYGWGKSVAKSQELNEAVKEMLTVILEQYPELKLKAEAS
jgi:hypothetical protein